MVYLHNNTTIDLHQYLLTRPGGRLGGSRATLTAWRSDSFCGVSYGVGDYYVITGWGKEGSLGKYKSLTLYNIDLHYCTTIDKNMSY